MYIHDHVPSFRFRFNKGLHQIIINHSTSHWVSELHLPRNFTVVIPFVATVLLLHNPCPTTYYPKEQPQLHSVQPLFSFMNSFAFPSMLLTKVNFFFTTAMRWLLQGRRMDQDKEVDRQFNPIVMSVGGLWCCEQNQSQQTWDEVDFVIQMLETMPWLLQTDRRTDDCRDITASKSTNSPRLISFCNVTVSYRWLIKSMGVIPLTDWLNGWMDGCITFVLSPSATNQTKPPPIHLTDPPSHSRSNRPFSLFAFIRSCFIVEKGGDTPPRSLSNNYFHPSRDLPTPFPLGATHRKRCCSQYKNVCASMTAYKSSSRLDFFVGFTGWWFHAPPAPPRVGGDSLAASVRHSVGEAGNSIISKTQVWSKNHRIVVLQTHAATLLNASIHSASHRSSSSFNNNW